MKKIITNFIFYFLLFSSFLSWGQEDKANSFGVNIITLPFRNSYSYIEYEYFVTDRFSVSGRVVHFKKYDSWSQSWQGVVFNNTNEFVGSGAGVSFRFHFGSRPKAGFYLGTGIDVLKVQVTYNEYDSWAKKFISGEYDEVSPVPNVQMGYHINLGELIYLTPSVNLNIFPVGEFITVMPGTTIGIRF